MSGANQSPGPAPASYTIPPPQIQTSYISSSQTQSPIPGAQFGGQTVTYYPAQNPVITTVPQQFIRPAQPAYSQVVETGNQIIHQGQVNPPALSVQTPVQVVQQPPVIQSTQQVGQYTENRTTTSTYTYGQYPPTSNQYVPQGSGQYVQTVQNVQYVRAPVPSFQQVEGDRQKSNMELTLEKIDEQLQMSRKMFPS